MRKHPMQSTGKKKRLVPHEQSSNAEHGKEERLAVHDVASSAEHIYKTERLVTHEKASSAERRRRGKLTHSLFDLSPK